MFPYLILNVVGLVVIAWKSVPMLGFLDLRRLQAAAEHASAAVAGALEDALDACEDAQQQALEDAQAVAAAATANASQAREQLAECRAIVERVRSDGEAISDSLVACEMKYRETVQSVHIAGADHPRFADEPVRLPPIELTIDPSLVNMLQALEARSVRMRESLPDVQKSIYDAVDKVRVKINEMLDEAETVARSSRGGATVLQMRR